MKLTEHQMMIVKGMVEFAKASANQIYHIMQNHDLDKIDGCYLNISVDPTRQLTTMNITVGSTEGDFGHISFSRGVDEDEYTVYGINSPEYELLFANETVRKAMEERLHREKPFPPDGMWVGASGNSDPVDGWEWDVNDSLS